MCGIGGILFSSDAPERLGVRAAAMRRALRHRGPDDEGELIEPGHALVATRLALVDPAGGAQPMRDASGRYVVVHNGEIENAAALRAAWRGRYEFRTRSDTEVLLAGFALLGEAVLDALEGMFAFCIWDRRERRAFLARDALGVKPLVLCRRGDETIFASEAKAILAQLPGRPPLDEEAVVEALVAPPLSGVRRAAFAGLEHLGAGEHLVVEARGWRRSRWFDYRIAEAPPPDRAALVAELAAAVETAVDRALVADRPVGSFLSGGLDSTALTALAARRRPPLIAYTIRFAAHETIGFDPGAITHSDDAPFVEEAARTLPIALHRVEAGPEALLARVDRVSADDDRIPAWEQELTQSTLAERAARDLPAVLVGDAADETHFGYFFLLDEAVTRDPLGLLARFGAAARAELLDERLRRDDPVGRLAAEYRALCQKAGHPFEADGLRATSHLVVTLWLGRLLANGDAHTMAYGLEARVPFANRGVLDVAARVPPAWGYDGREEKKLLRDALAPQLPPSIARRKKSALPADPRMAPRYQAALARALAARPDATAGFLDPARLRALCERPPAGELDRMILFNVLSFQRFCEMYRG